MPTKKIEATEKLRGKESKWRAKKFTAQNFKKGGAKNEGGNKKGGVVKYHPSFFIGQIWKVSIKVLSF